MTESDDPSNQRGKQTDLVKLNPNHLRPDLDPRIPAIDLVPATGAIAASNLNPCQNLCTSAEIFPSWQSLTSCFAVLSEKPSSSKPIIIRAGCPCPYLFSCTNLLEEVPRWT